MSQTSRFSGVAIHDAHVFVGQSDLFDVSPSGLLDIMDKNGISRAMLSPSDRWLAVDNREGNDAILEAARRWPDRFGGYATANPWYGQRALAELERALDHGLSAIKLHPGRHGFMLLEPLVDGILQLADQRGVPVYVVTGIATASMPLQLAEQARRFPGINFVMGRSGRTDFGWLDLSAAVQQAPNIYLETVYNLPGMLDTLIELVGAERVLFASDTPLTNLALELEKLTQLRAGPAVLPAILGDNLARLMRWPEGR